MVLNGKMTKFATYYMVSASKEEAKPDKSVLNPDML